MKEILKFEINKEYDLVILERDNKVAPYIVTIKDKNKNDYFWNLYSDSDKNHSGWACVNLHSANKMFQDYAKVFSAVFR